MFENFNGVLNYDPTPVVRGVIFGGGEEWRNRVI
jgi:hypothetical protein